MFGNHATANSHHFTKILVSKGYSVRNNTVISTLSLALIFSTPFASAIESDSNPISNFLGALQKIADGPGAAPAKRAESPSDMKSDDVLQSIANEHGADSRASSGTCRYLLDDDGKMLIAQKTENFHQVSILAQIRAANVAACSLRGAGASIAQAKNDVGQLLTISALNANQADMVTENTLRHAKYAIILLKLNATANQNSISALENVFWPKGPVADSKAFAVMTAKDAATKYIANSFAFLRTYSNKTLQIKGRVQSINGHDDRASVTLEGIIQKDINDQGWQHIVACNVQSKDALDDVARISKGDMITVQGIFTPRTLPGVSLDDCRVVR
ncbi:hypothetical protein G3257_16770 [Janthinobacterium lividum]|uniref:OB-fold protein n=1 Tax=Janthinobacterium lividum TaxID=29581 RepID=UPI001595A8C1|nr:hypothetical protein [Janthinobacterium lividum]QKY03745.1 hypothetical protein G3257_16770 [Janthinobacterium lividum]